MTYDLRGSSHNRYAPLGGAVAKAEKARDDKMRSQAIPPGGPGAIGPVHLIGEEVADGADHLTSFVGLVKAHKGECSSDLFPVCVLAIDDRGARADGSLLREVNTRSGTWDNVVPAAEALLGRFDDAGICVGSPWQVRGSTGVETRWAAEAMGLALVCFARGAGNQVAQIAGVASQALDELLPSEPGHSDTLAITCGALAAVGLGLCSLKPVRGMVGSVLGRLGNWVSSARVAPAPQAAVEVAPDERVDPEAPPTVAPPQEVSANAQVEG